jgi:hypothetical protein
MKFFGFGKKEKVLDLTGRYRKQQEKASEIKKDMEDKNSVQETSPVMGFLGNFAKASSQQNDSQNYPDNERKKKLAKRLMDLTSKIEELSNQIYHLQQRVELLEKKSGI